MMPSPLLSGYERFSRLYESSTYPDLNVSSRLLRLALEHHRDLHDVVDPERMIIIAGTGQPTWTDIEDMNLLSDNASYVLTNLGDGRITHELTRLTAGDSEVPAYFIEEGHANLLANEQILHALNELLERGETSDLSREVPVSTWTQEECLRARVVLDQEMQADEKRAEEIVNRIRARGGAGRSPDSDFVSELARWRGNSEPVAIGTPEELPPLISTDEGELADLITRDVLARSVRATRSAIAEPEPTTMRFEIDLIVGNIEDFQPKEDLPVDAVAVGHYAGVLPQAAERAIDDAISNDPGKPGILTRFAQRGLIRGDLGQPFIIPDPRAPDDRVIVLAGMGLPGRFGAPELTVLARELCWTMAQLGRSHLATVLIGAGMGNLDLDIAVACWLRGLATALDPRSADLLFPFLQGRVAEDAEEPEMPFASVRRITFVQRRSENALQMLQSLQRTIPEIEEEHGLSVSYLGPDKETLLKLITAERLEHLQKLVQEAEQAEKAAGADESPDQQVDRGDLQSSTRITVGMTGNVYRFGAITTEAAIPEREISLDPGLVMSANNELAAESNPDLQLERGVFLQGLLMPAEVRTHLQSNEPVVMMLDATTARIHWEMVAQPDPTVSLAAIQAGGNLSGAGTSRKFQRDRFLGTSRGFTRQLRTPFASLPDPPAAPRKTLRVLVVADPSEDMPLAGAEAEGLEVADVFAAYNRAAQGQGTGNQVVVDRLLGPREATRTTTLRYLMLRPYDVLHFAGHCFFQADRPDASGWIFSNGETISAHELNRIDRIPRFVFSNACESGVTPDRSELRSDGLAPSFAEAFFARGVANFVCTAWPVDDAAARRFARTLYLGLLGLKEEDGNFRFDGEPQPMHIAMQRARIDLAQRASGARTWGAYQHYGNPLYRFFSVSRDRATSGVAERADDTGARRNSAVVPPHDHPDVKDSNGVDDATLAESAQSENGNGTANPV
ncbi:MAG: CHAT domain-containing protein, partial [Thermomicrobiales bacterium]